MIQPQEQCGRSYGTTEERQVLALEMIADELVLICQELARIGDHLCEPAKGPDASKVDEIPPNKGLQSISTPK